MYENIFDLYSDKILNLQLWALEGALIGLNYPEKTADGNYKSVEVSIDLGGNSIPSIILTGRMLVSASGNAAYQCIFSDGSYGYIWEDNASCWSKTNPENTDAVPVQNILNELIGFNQSILEGNLLCARIIEYCQDNGIALPANGRTDLYNLQLRLNTRNDKIKSSGYVEQIKEDQSPNFNTYNDALVSFMQNPGSSGIGIIPVLVYVVVSAIVLAATAYLAIDVYKQLHAEAKADFGFSNDLTAQLVKFLPPDTYKQLLAENAANAKKAQDAIDAASGKSFMNTLKYIGVGILSVWAFDKFIINRNNK